MVKAAYRPNDQSPALPDSRPIFPRRFSSPMRCSISPQIEADYYDWAASVENVTVGRSLPNPQLTFQATSWMSFRR